MWVTFSLALMTGELANITHAVDKTLMLATMWTRLGYFCHFSI
jgi:hypothetical protein